MRAYRCAANTCARRALSTVALARPFNAAPVRPVNAAPVRQATTPHTRQATTPHTRQATTAAEESVTLSAHAPTSTRRLPSDVLTAIERFQRHALSSTLTTATTLLQDNSFAQLAALLDDVHAMRSRRPASDRDRAALELVEIVRAFEVGYVRSLERQSRKDTKEVDGGGESVEVRSPESWESARLAAVTSLLRALTAVAGPHGLTVHSRVLDVVARTMDLSTLRKDAALADALIGFLSQAQQPLLLDLFLGRVPEWRDDQRLLPALMEAFSRRCGYGDIHGTAGNSGAEAQAMVDRCYALFNQRRLRTAHSVVGDRSTADLQRVEMAMLRSLAARGAVRRARESVQSMRFIYGWDVSSEAYMLLVRAHSNVLLQRMLLPGHSYYAATAKSVAVVDHLVRSVNAVLGQCKQAPWKMTESVYREFITFYSRSCAFGGLSQSGASAGTDTISYHTDEHKVERARRAEQLLREALEQGVPATAEIFAQVVSAWVRAGSAENALRVRDMHTQYGGNRSSPLVRPLLDMQMTQATFPTLSRVERYVYLRRIVKMMERTHDRSLLLDEDVAMSYAKAMVLGGKDLEWELRRFVHLAAEMNIRLCVEELSTSDTHCVIQIQANTKCHRFRMRVRAVPVFS